MLNDSGNRNPLQNAIYSLMNLPASVTKAALHNITRPFGMMGDVFTRQNIVNAMMPKTLATGVNSVLDMVAARKKAAPSSSSSSTEPKKTKQVQEDEEDFDPSQGGWVEDDEYDDDDGPSAAAMDIDGSLDEIEEDEGESEEILSEILDEIQNGFGQSNENLALLLERFGVNNNNEEPVMMRWDEEGMPDPVAKIDPAQLEELVDDDDEFLAELVELNGVIIQKLDQIDKNTRRDTLAEREAELESKSASAVVSNTADELAKAQKDKDSSLIGAIADSLGSAALGAAGLGAAGLGAKGAAGKLGKILGKTRAPTAGLASAVSAEAQAAPAIAKSVEAAVKPTSKIAAVGKGAGRVLGAPLAVGLGAYEAYQVAQDEALTSEQKTTEYSKIGGKTVGALAGAKAGAVLGAIGGPVGSVIGGLLGGIGGFFLGEKGGEIVGDLINKVLPSSTEPKIDDPAKSAEIAANIVKPDIQGVTAGNTRVTNLEQLTQRIEQTAANKQDAMMQPIIAPVTIHNNNTTNNGSSQQQSRMPVPSVRNQDGTIQRLLDANYRPLIK